MISGYPPKYTLAKFWRFCHPKKKCPRQNDKNEVFVNILNAKKMKSFFFDTLRKKRNFSSFSKAKTKLPQYELCDLCHSVFITTVIIWCFFNEELTQKKKAWRISFYEQEMLAITLLFLFLQLNHFRLLFISYTPWKHKKTSWCSDFFLECGNEI